MKILLDTDVLLDVALRREEHFPASAHVVQWSQRHPGSAAVAWHTLSTLAYLIRPDARPFIQDLLGFVHVAPVGTHQALQAVGFHMSDLEDALQASAALAWGARWIVTRNTKDFKNSPVPAIHPAAFLNKS